mmetsp:Transcript_20821/g.31357  ORF Transcript_20821/g.31357 Transcript_20821/m.31357 type:complete len:137 (-) Transcript_20821:389-799(-)
MNTAAQGTDRAEEGVGGDSVADNLPANPILLISELEGTKRCRREIGFRRMKVVNAVGGNKQLDIVETKGSCCQRGAGVFPRKKEEKESQRDHIRNGQNLRCVQGQGVVDQSPENAQWNWFHAHWRGVLAFPGAPKT